MSEATKLVERAIDLSDDEDYEGAIKLLTKAIAADPGNGQAYFERGMALLNLDRDADAIPDFDNALRIDPDFPGARDWRAKALGALGDHKQAALGHMEELRRNPDGPEGMGVCPQDWADCAEAFIAAGDRETARAVLSEYFAGPVEKVTEYQCYATAPMRVMARLAFDAGELDLAHKFASDAAANENSCPADQEIHGVVLAYRGDVAQAERIYEELVEGLPPGVPYALDLKAAIEAHKQ